MKNKPFILGHRGYNARFPENTILSFAKAAEYGADGIECDIQKTADQRYIVFHDDELFRITGHSGFIRDVNFAELSVLDAGMGERIPDFEAFLNSLRGHKLKNIELKEETITREDFPRINSAIEHSGFKNDVLISSMKHELVIDYRDAGYRTGLLFDVYPFKDNMFRAFRSVLRHKPFSVNLPIDVFTRDSTLRARLFLAAMKFLKVAIIYWTVNTEEQYNSVKDYAYAVITDNVELMVSLRDRD